MEDVNTIQLDSPVNNRKITGKFIKGMSGNPKGRPPGKTEVEKIRGKIKDHLTEKEIENLIKIIKEKAKTDTRVLIFLTEQIFGKAPQAVQTASESKLWIVPNELAEKYGLVDPDLYSFLEARK